MKDNEIFKKRTVNTEQECESPWELKNPVRETSLDSRSVESSSLSNEKLKAGKPSRRSKTKMEIQNKTLDEKIFQARDFK